MTIEAANMTNRPAPSLGQRWIFARFPAQQDWLVPCVLLMAGAACLAIDIPVASFFKGPEFRHMIDGPIRESLQICEAFGHGFGVILILIAVAVLDPIQRRILPWAVAGSLGAGIAANLVKTLCTRTRPSHFDFAEAHVWDTFLQSSAGGTAFQSFPSAHTATAFGLAVTLVSLYPRGRFFFLSLAVLVGLQRIVASAHFPSDVCAGAAIGWMVGKACVSWSGDRRPSV